MSLPAMLTVPEEDEVVLVCVTLTSDADTERQFSVALTTDDDTGTI